MIAEIDSEDSEMGRQGNIGIERLFVGRQRILVTRSSEPGSRNEVSKERKNPESPTDFVEVD